MNPINYPFLRFFVMLKQVNIVRSAITNFVVLSYLKIQQFVTVCTKPRYRYMYGMYRIMNQCVYTHLLFFCLNAVYTKTYIGASIKIDFYYILHICKSILECLINFKNKLKVA